MKGTILSNTVLLCFHKYKYHCLPSVSAFKDISLINWRDSYLTFLGDCFFINWVKLQRLIAAWTHKFVFIEFCLGHISY